MLTTLLILGVSAVLFVQGRIRSDLVALCSLLCLIMFGILSPEQALSGFSNSIVVMMVGLFVVGGAIFRTGLAKMMGGRIMKLAGRSELRLLVLTMLVTAGIGAFVSNTGTVALMLPILVSLAADGGIQTSRLLMPMAFASSMGGMLTLIGTPPNLVVNNQLQEAGMEGLGFFAFTPIGLVCIVTGILVLIPLSRKFLGRHDDRAEHEAKGKSLSQLIDEYQIINNLYRLRVLEDSPLTEHPLHDLQIPDLYRVNIVEVRRRHSGRHSFLQTVSQTMAGSDTRVARGDVIYVMGEFEDVARFAREYGAEMINRKTSEDTDSLLKSKLKFDEIGIAEMLLMRNSDLINMPVKSSGLRAKYGVNILAIQRDNHYIFHNLKDVKLQYGDTLLVQGTWTDIARLSEKTFEWVVVGQPLAEASKVTLTHKAPLAAGIMLLMIAAMVFNWVPAVAAVLIAAVLMVLCGCLRNVEEAYRTINWESIVLIAAMLPMSVALEKTGASEAISHGLVAGLGGIRAVCPDGGRLFHGVPADHVYQQYSYGGASGAYRAAILGEYGHQPLSAAAGGFRRYQHVFCLSLFHAAQCPGHAGGEIYVHGLRESGRSPAGDYGAGYGRGDSAIFPVREGLTGGSSCGGKGAWPGNLHVLLKKERQPARAGVEKDYSKTPFNHEVFAYCSGRCVRHAFHGGGRRSQENDFCGEESRSP